MAKQKHHDEHADEHVAEALHAGEHHPVVESGADIDMWTIAAVGLASTFFIVATVLFVQALDNRMTSAMKANKGWSTVDSSAYKSDQATRLAGYRWVDKAQRSVAIPLEDAKKLTVQKGLPEWPAENGEKKEEDKPAPAPEEEGAGGAAPEEEGAGGGTAEGETETEGEVEAPVPPEAPPEGKGKGKGPKGPEGQGGQGKGGKGEGKGGKAPAPKAPAPKAPAQPPPAPPAAPEDPYGN